MNQRVGLIATSLAFAVAAPLPAIADDRPPEFVAHDVTITYTLVSGRDDVRTPVKGATVTSFQAGTGNARTDTDPPTLVIISNITRDRFYVLRPEQKTYVEVEPTDMTSSPLVLHKMRTAAVWTKGARETLLGRECDDWSGQAGIAVIDGCYTAEGYAMRYRSTATTPDGKTAWTERTAERVDVAPIAPEMFLPPADYRALPPAHGLVQAIRDALRL